MTDHDLNDSLSDLLNGEFGKYRTAPVAPVIDINAPRVIPTYKSAEQRFEEGCAKCGGSGRFISWGGRDVGPCFACKGAGKKVFKTSAATRADNREKSAMKKASSIAESILEFKAANPAVHAWIIAECSKSKPFEFAIAMVEALNQYGSLTDRQLETCERLAAKAAERSRAVVEAPSVEQAGIDRLKASFDKAVAYNAEKGLKLSPRITISGITISPAKAHSANPGALYVKAGTTYLGKIASGRFYATSDCDKADETKILAFIADPEQAAKVYGQTTGTCCVCNATLRSEWKLRGIGPICAEKFGWA